VTAEDDYVWYYAVGGERRGPVGGAVLQDVIARGTLTPDTLVWRPGLAAWVPARGTELMQTFARLAVPPPLPPGEADNSIIWVLAFAPLIGLLAEITLVQTFRLPAGSMWWVTSVLNCVLGIWDERRLHKAGYSTRNWIWLVLLLVPAYLFVRASRLKQSKAYAWTWLGVFCLTLLVRGF
jgi:hypothetical protein